MIGANQQLVTDEPVEFEKQPVEVHQDCRKITHRFRGIYNRNTPIQGRKSEGCEHVTGLDVQTLGSQPVVMPTQKSPQSLI